MSSPQSILVLGLGVSGTAATELLCGEGHRVTAVDAGSGEALDVAASSLRERGAEISLSDELPGGAYDLAVVSPGIAADSAWMKEVADRGLPAISELELGWSRCAARLIAVTGSNGKSTCVKLCHDALQRGGLSSAIAGNYGPPLSAVVSGAQQPDVIIAEVSSFQLETVHDFKPDIAILLNILPNHLDRHGDMDVYAGLKSRMFRRMTRDDLGIVGLEWLEFVRRESGGDCRWVSVGRDDSCDYRFVEHDMVWKDGRRAGLTGTPFDNPVMGIAAAAAAAAVEACGVTGDAVVEAARGFETLPHRMQSVATRGGVAFVDDSKATNIAALDAALRMIDGPVRLIAGGQLKENDVMKPKIVLASKVRAAYLIGEAMTTLEAEWRDVVPCRSCRTLDVAVEKAWLESKPGDTILLSPACASFDQFESFEERGNAFVKCVEELPKEA